MPNERPFGIHDCSERLLCVLASGRTPREDPGREPRPPRGDGYETAANKLTGIAHVVEWHEGAPILRANHERQH